MEAEHPFDRLPRWVRWGMLAVACGVNVWLWAMALEEISKL